MRRRTRKKKAHAAAVATAAVGVGVGAATEAFFEEPRGCGHIAGGAVTSGNNDPRR